MTKVHLRVSYARLSLAICLISGSLFLILVVAGGDQVIKSSLLNQVTATLILLVSYLALVQAIRAKCYPVLTHDDGRITVRNGIWRKKEFALDTVREVHIGTRATVFIGADGNSIATTNTRLLAMDEVLGFLDHLRQDGVKVFRQAAPGTA